MTQKYRELRSLGYISSRNSLMDNCPRQSCKPRSYPHRGKQGELLTGTTIFVILVILFATGLLAAVWKYSHDAAYFESFYAKEIARVVNSAEDGDEITLDVHRATEIAQKNKVEPGALRYVIRFDGARREVIAGLRKAGETRFSYFNNVMISEVRIEEERGNNVLKFRVGRAEREKGEKERGAEPGQEGGE